jgi:hypothetical protein
MAAKLLCFSMKVDSCCKWAMYAISKWHVFLPGYHATWFVWKYQSYVICYSSPNNFALLEFLVTD